MRCLMAAALLTLASTAPAWADTPEEADPQSPPAGGETAVVSTAPVHRYFRLGFRFFGSFDYDGGDAAVLRPGMSLTVPLTLDFKYGLGMRVSFAAAYYWNNTLGVAWNSVPNDASTLTEHTVDRGEQDELNSQVAYYGLTVGFNYEVTVPNEPFFKVMQPFVGVGAAIVWVRTHPDIPTDHDHLINNEFYNGPDEKPYDPWSLQVRAGLDLYAGFHINASRTFRIPIEFGYRMVPVPAEELMWATEGFDYQHLDYVINTFNIGGGLEGLF